MTTEHWNHPRSLPTPGCRLILLMQCGRTLDGIRPSYVESRDGELGYETIDGETVSSETIKGWAYA